MSIREIRRHQGANYYTFRVHDCREGTFALIMEETPLTEKYGTTIRIEIQTKRLQQLGNEILNYLNREAKLHEWQPTIGEIIIKVQEIVARSGINYWRRFMDVISAKATGEAVEAWFIEWIRTAHALKNEKHIAEAQRIYEWLHSNKEWLYSNP